MEGVLFAENSLEASPIVPPVAPRRPPRSSKGPPQNAAGTDAPGARRRAHTNTGHVTSAGAAQVQLVLDPDGFVLTASDGAAVVLAGPGGAAPARPATGRGVACVSSSHKITNR